MKIVCQSLPPNLIPKAAELGLQDLYVNNNKIWGYVIIEGKRYRIMKDRIVHYFETGRTFKTAEEYGKKVNSFGINL